MTDFLRLRSVLPAAAVLVAAPFVPAIVASQAGPPVGQGPGVHRQVEPGSGPAGSAPVAERHVAGDMVVDWLEAPPAGAEAWLAAQEDADGGDPTGTGQRDYDPQQPDGDEAIGHQGADASADADGAPAAADPGTASTDSADASTSPTGNTADASADSADASASPTASTASTASTEGDSASDGQEPEPQQQWAAAGTGTSSGASAAPGEGFAVFSPAPRWRAAGYTIRLTGDARVEHLRDDLTAAAQQAQAATGIPVRVAPGRGGPEQPAVGEITVVLGTGPCGTSAAGCGGPAFTQSELVTGRVWLSPSAVSYSSADQRHLAGHELGHALGLQHYSGSWSDGRQAMHPQVSGISTYRAGDTTGLRFMAGRLDRPAGTVTERAYAAGQVRVAGTLSSGTTVRVTVAGTARDVAAEAGRFAASLPAGAGSHQVCASVLDAAAGFRRDLGCASVSAPGAPVGALQAVTGSFETVVVHGWALDPQTADPVSVEVRRNGAVVLTAPASAPRPDVAQAHPAYGEAHGFTLEVPAVEGANQVCVRVLGVGAGGNAELGCGVVTHAVQPLGAFEVATGGDLHATVTGWALDPNTADPVEVLVSVDGGRPALPGAIRADDDRPDVARAHPAHGPAHGFADRLVLTPGTHQVCLTVRNVGLGQDRPLGCATVEVGPRAAAPVAPVLEAVTGLLPPLPVPPVTALAPVTDVLGLLPLPRLLG